MLVPGEDYMPRKTHGIPGIRGCGFFAVFRDSLCSPIRADSLRGPLELTDRVTEKGKPYLKRRNGFQADAEGSRGGRRGACRNDDLGRTGEGIGEKELREETVTDVGGISDAWSVGGARREVGKSWLHSQRGTGLLFGCWQRSKVGIENRKRVSGAEAERCSLGRP